MAGSKKDAWENEVLDHCLGTTASTFNATVYCALYTVAPADATQGTEVTNANAYARTAISFGAAASGAASNDVACTFAEATGSWGTVVAFAIHETATHGTDDAIYWGDLTTSKSVSSGETASFAIGDVDITED